MTSAPRGFRVHIGVFGRRNAGKSTLMNAVAGQTVSLVSPTAGTTADPVEKAMEFPPLGPSLWIDTAGLDDEGGLGELRAEAARRVLDRIDLAVVVLDGNAWGECEDGLRRELSARGIPAVVVLNKADLHPGAEIPRSLADDKSVAAVRMSAASGAGLDAFRQAVIGAVPPECVETPPLVRDLLPAGETAVLVAPIDEEAPRGRLILPQAQTIRDLLDGGCRSLVTGVDGLRDALDGLKRPPALVVTDSQAFKQVAALIPPEMPLTGFSILFARARGDLSAFAAGAAAIGRLRPGDTALIAESCSHHAGRDDIGRVKIPNLLNGRAGGGLRFVNLRGHDFPSDLSGVGLVVHCGACMANRREVLSRIARCMSAGTPVTNYGMAIAYCLGLLERALGPFPAALEAYRKAAQ